MKENLYSNCIRTFTGKYIDVFNPDPEMICIEDIAHALAQTPRFGGHLKHFYSVAHHSMHCSELVRNDKLAALMHDASEAYLTDMPRPIKMQMPQYREVEDRLMTVISKKFGFQYPLSKEVKIADENALSYEWNILMINGLKSYIIDAEAEFIRYFEKYKYLTINSSNYLNM